MGFGDVLAGLAEASHEHQKTLLAMQHEQHKQASELLGKLATDPRFTPEQQKWMARGAIAHLSGDEKEAKKYDISKGTINIPVSVMAPSAPINVGQPSQEQADLYNEPLPPSTYQPPPSMQTQQRDVMQPMSFEEMLMQQQAGGRAGLDLEVEKARRVAEAQLPSKIAETRATQEAQKEFAIPPVPPRPLAPPTPPAAVGEYNFYKQEEEKAGRTPMSFDAWQTRDANRKKPSVPATVQILNSTQPESGMDPEMSDALQRATMSMIPTRRAQVFNTVNGMVKKGDVDKARSTIRQAALESEPVAVRSQVQGRREVLKSLSDIEQLLKKVPTNLIAGTLEDTVRKLGATTDPNYVRLATRLGLLNQAYRRSMTGAQFSKPEAEEYASILPNYRDMAPVNAEKIAALREAFSANDRVFWDNKLGPGWADADIASGGGAGSRGGVTPGTNPVVAGVAKQFGISYAEAEARARKLGLIK